ncbi:MAG: hypothetical protein H6738_15770 [Alphaproteobacteria bacterium]|nr:hypothetical protein [Alphaproteobacteria bacterium]MCB9698237.1 hypothetical protein [Alphaproteobacteria bacterium]
MLEEAAFLAVLPTSDRLAPPEALRTAPQGPDPVLAAGQAAAERWFGLVELPIALGDALRAEVPDERTTVARRWAPFEVAQQIDGDVLGVTGSTTSWASAEILQLDDGSFEWTVSLAASRTDDPRAIGHGTQQGRLGEQVWDLTAAAEALGSDATPGQLSLDTTDPDPEGTAARQVDADLRRGPVSEPWQLLEITGIAFVTDLAITEDGLAWPAAATVFHDGAAGIGAGIVQQGTAELSFTACWDGAGTTASRTGDPGIAEVAGPPCGP